MLAVDVLGLLMIASFAVFNLYRAVRLIRGGSLNRMSAEYRVVLARLNMLADLRGRPRQQEITMAQMRNVGISYIVGNALVLALAVLALARLLMRR